MGEINKVVGVGMSKTGTTTLAACFGILSVGPHKSYDRLLKARVVERGDIEGVLDVAEDYRSFEDSPWYLIFKEFDQRFPNSKYILTVRKDSVSHAKSSWYHGVAAGLRKGEPPQEYIDSKVRIYEGHNEAVLEYFKDRPDDLLVLCWEEGDGWNELCGFLGEDIPDVPVPWVNTGAYRKNVGMVTLWFRSTWLYALALRVRYALSRHPLMRKLKRAVQNQD